jgi:putative membrane protein
MMHWGWGDYGMGGYGLGWLFMIVFWAVVILGVIYLVKMLAGGSGKSSPQETAEDILRKRFARGELSKAEFEEALKVLKQHD